MGNEIEDIHTRLWTFVQYTGMSESAFCSRLGFSNGFLGKIIKNKISFGIDKAQRILYEFPELNCRWLLLGEGDMITRGNFGRYNDVPPGATPEEEMKDMMERLANEVGQLKVKLHHIETPSKPKKSK
jgi:hypothetical protein